MGSMLHICWGCPLIKSYWLEVNRTISSVSTLMLNYTPAQYLPHHTSLPRKLLFKSLAMHMVNAVRLCVPVSWGSTWALTIRDLLSCLHKMADVEERFYVSI